jgi:hypothetical protein
MYADLGGEVARVADVVASDFDGAAVEGGEKGAGKGYFCHDCGFV